MITADFTSQHILFVTFNDFSPVAKDESSKLMQARTRIKEAGYDFQPYGLTDIVTRKWREDGKFIPNLAMHESMHCDPYTLASAALSLDRDQLVDLLTEAFEVYRSAKAAYEAKIEQYQQVAGTRRGRPPLAEGERRAAFVGANVAPDLKEWAALQPEGISALIQKLLSDERERRNSAQ